MEPQDLIEWAIATGVAAIILAILFGLAFMLFDAMRGK